jgi:Ca2+-binding EF-hand superfamily protein
MPATPVHNKFSMSEVAKEKTHEEKTRPKFSVKTLRRWFQSIDSDGSGSISRREMLLALRNQKELKHIFSAASGDGHFQGPGGQKVIEENREMGAAESLRVEMQHILNILHEVDADGSGTMEWEEVLEFFRRSGYLLEYVTKKELNNPFLVDDEDGRGVPKAESSPIASQYNSQDLVDGDGDVLSELRSSPSIHPNGSPPSTPRTLRRNSVRMPQNLCSSPKTLRRNSVRTAPAASALKEVAHFHSNHGTPVGLRAWG